MRNVILDFDFIDKSGSNSIKKNTLQKSSKKAAVKILSIFRAKVILRYLFCKEVRKFEFRKNLNNLDELGKKML